MSTMRGQLMTKKTAATLAFWKGWEAAINIDKSDIGMNESNLEKMGAKELRQVLRELELDED